MKIKLNRKLWGSEKDDTINVDVGLANWAIKRGLAVKAETTKRKNKAEPKDKIKNK
jgi:hypothetical protein